jgi:methylamine dehydrogenase accessory protein MauD
MNMLIIAVVVLWILVIGLALTVYALTRQIGVLYERVAPAGALMLNQALKVNDAAPQLAVQTLTGTTLNIGRTEGAEKPQLLFFLAPDCPICKSLLPVIKSIAKREQQVDVVLASDGDDVAEHETYVQAQDLGDFPYVLSELLGKSYGVSKLPYAVLIRGNGTIGSLGIVNSREHLESLFEAESLGIASLQDYLAGAPSDQFVDATAKRL